MVPELLVRFFEVEGIAVAGSVGAVDTEVADPIVEEVADPIAVAGWVGEVDWAVLGEVYNPGILVCPLVVPFLAGVAYSRVVVEVVRQIDL